MAIINITPVMVGSGGKVSQWSGLKNGDVGEPMVMPKRADKSVQVHGVFGVGGNVIIEGSNDPRVISDPANAVWVVLTDPQANALNTITTARIEQILENPVFIRPRVSAGDGTTSIDAIINAV